MCVLLSLFDRLLSRIYFEDRTFVSENTLTQVEESCNKTFISRSANNVTTNYVNCSYLFPEDYLPQAQGHAENYYYESLFNFKGLGPLEMPINLDIIGYRGDIFDFLMIVTNFLTSVKNVTSFKGFFMPLFTLLSQITCKSYTQIVKHYSRYIYAIFGMVFGLTNDFKHEIFNDDPKEYAQFIEQIPIAQADNSFSPDDSFQTFWDGLKNISLKHKTVLNSKFAQKFANFCGMIVCLPLFGNNGTLLDLTMFGFSKGFVYRMKKQNKVDHPLLIVDQIIDSMTFITDKVYLAVKNNDMSYIWLDDEILRDYDIAYNKVMYYFDRLDLLSNQIHPDTGEPMTMDDYLRDVEKLCWDNERYRHQMKNDAKAIAMLKSQQLCLDRCKMRVRDKMRINAEREPPLGFVLHGTPKIGKSSLIHHLCTMLYQNAKRLGRSYKEYDKSMLYSYNSNDAYFSQFRVSHEICVIDDVGQIKPLLANGEGGGSIRQSCNLINSVPYTTEQAEIENKGMIPFMCKYVILTTNIRDAGISNVFREESGAKRRYIFFDTVVKEEYRVPRTTTLKGCGDPTNHEMWEFVPRMYQNMGGHNNEVVWDKHSKKWVGHGNPVDSLSMFELQLFLYEIQQKHYNATDAEKACVEHFMESGFCDECKVNFALCPCEKLYHDSVETDDEFEETLPLIQSRLPFKINTQSWTSAFFKAFGWKGVFKLLKYKCVDNWNYFKSDLLNIYTNHRQQCHKYLGIAGLLSSLLFIRRGIKWYIKLKDHDFLGESHGNVPTSVNNNGEKTDNPWVVSYKDAQRVTGLPVTTTLDKLSNTITHNCVTLRAHLKDDHATDIRGLGMHGFTLVAPKHWVDRYSSEWSSVDIIRHDLRSKIGPSRYKLKIDESCIYSVPDQDICYITHPGFGMFRDLRPYLLTDRFSGILEGNIIFRNTEGVMQYNEVFGLQSKDFRYRDYDGTILACRGYYGQTKVPTKPGQCGAPYIVQTLKGCFLAGFHVAGTWTTDGKMYISFCQPLLLNDVIPTKAASFNGVSLVDTYPRCQKEFVPSIHKKDPILQSSGCITVYGDTNGFRPKIKSDVCDTLMNYEVREHYGLLENTHVSPKGCSYTTCLKNNYDQVGEKATFEPKHIEEATHSIYVWFSRVIEREKIFIPNKPYDRFIGINGIDGDYYINRLPVNTSGGFTRGGRKDQYLIELPPDSNHEIKYDLDSDTMKEYLELKQRYLRGEKGQVVWNYNFKDEPISHKKHQASKVRLFNAGTLAFNVLFREYYLWTIPIFSGKLNYKFGSAIGTNCYSKDWTKLYNYITMHGKDRVIAGDYKGFDKKQPAEVLWACFEILFKLVEDKGWKADDIMIMRGLATDICFSMCNVFGTLVELQGNNPSGNPLTTILNGIVNVTYIMLACKKIARDKDIDINWDYFPHYVSILTYGDDNIMSSSIDEFNHTSISEALAYYNLIYTMADKESKSIPFINIKDADFLKRRFVPDVNKEGVMACPLDEASIIKSLHVCTKSRTISFNQQMAEIISSASFEYFQYGYEKFHVEYEFLNKLLDRHSLRMYLKDGVLPSYEELYDKFCA